MKIHTISFWAFQGSILSFLLLISFPSVAQIIPDKTLPINSQVTHQGNTNQIDGGTAKGSNLFHSFSQFSIDPGSTAYFNNGANIQNIFTRITGNSISNINGILKANGAANFFLINPNGIIFGKNAQLNIGGSFLATIANAIKFADKFELRADKSQIKPLLTISVPVGLIIAKNSGIIQVNGTGQGLIALSSPSTPTVRNNGLTGLQVKPGKTLALVGGHITLEGGNLIAEQGRIELGSVEDGTVSISPTNQNWILNYDNISYFKDIDILQQSLFDASGNAGGSIILQAKNISLLNGSIFIIQNQDLPSGSINIKAFDSLQLTGGSPDGKFVTLLRTEALGFGKGADIDISAKSLVTQQGAGISTRTYGSGRGGDLNISAFDIKLLGFLPSNNLVASSILTSANLFSSGNAGNIKVSTERLLAQDGGLISSLTLGQGNGGDVFINAIDSIEFTNSKELINSGQFYVPSYLASQTFNNGNAGNLTINTLRFMLKNKAFANTSTQASGSAGVFTLNADNVQIISSSAGASATKALVETQHYLSSPPVPSGSPGGVNINTGYLSLTNGGQVSIANEGTSMAGGKLTISANTINLMNNGSINASTASGEGGDIFLSSNLLQIHNSSITATADTSGNGGNIHINTDILTASNNSAITANAYRGRGGNIRINTKGLFISSDTQITASSERGINGTVQINVQDRNPSQTKVQPQVIAKTPEVASVCQDHSGGVRSTFMNIGAGGLAASSDNQLDNSSTWQRNSTPLQAIDNWEQSKPSTTEEPIEIVEAQGWILNADGDIVLTAQANPPSPYAEVSASRCQELPSTQPVSSITEMVRLK